MLLNIDKIIDFINAHPTSTDTAMARAGLLTLPIEKLVTGVYGSLNLDSHLRDVLMDDEPILVFPYPLMDKQQREWDRVQAARAAGDSEARFPLSCLDKSDYVVSDTVEQALAYFAEEVADTEVTYVMGAFPFLKAEQPEHGGWRWHKWGPYIGEKQPRCEYLHDEGDDIEEIYCCHLYLVQLGSAKQEPEEEEEEC